MTSYHQYLKREIERCEKTLQTLPEERKIICNGYIQRLKARLKIKMYRIENSIAINQELIDRANSYNQ